MSQERLTKLLAELHGELEQAQHLDAETRSRIEDAAAELNEVLAAEDKAGEQSAFNALRERLLSLEVAHPRVSAIIGETAELISKLGA